ncbi:MAG: energy transducer TonB [Bacteroidia bacterium]|nr:energy transducer TonB [Bacteroidia bacterium]
MKTGWNGEVYTTRNDVVFDERNKQYGAYDIRQNYSKRMMFVLGGVLLFSIALLGAKKIIDNAPEETDIVQDMSNIAVDLTPPPPAEELPPPPPPPPPPPMVEMVKFVPPVIKDDAVEEEPQKLQDDVKDTNVGEKDQEGDKDLVAPPTEVAGPAETAAPEIFTIVEENAEFPGGITAMQKYMRDNTQYPAVAREAGISGKCFLKFVVNENGDISNVEILKGVPGCPDCDREAIRVVKSMPKWKPAKMTGRSVKCYFNLPFSFKIQ